MMLGVRNICILFNCIVEGILLLINFFSIDNFDVREGVILVLVNIIIVNNINCR